MIVVVDSSNKERSAFLGDLLAHGTLMQNGAILQIDDAIYLALKVKHNRSAPHRLGNALAAWVSKGMPITPPEELTKRQEMCATCEHFTGSRCKLCGCFTQAKLRMATEKCPIGKW
jgi:hypothetical protein